jgi:hypothetical protein
MKLIPFSGMMCHPLEIVKDGDFRIKGTISRAINEPALVRYEYFACIQERDQKYNLLVNLLKEDK